MLAKFSVKKPLTVLVAVILVLILGFVSFTSMTPDLLPNMDFPMAVLMTTYPGASPEEVETTVTKPLEQSMATLENISAVTSSSGESYSILFLEFNDSVNMDAISVDIREKISLIEGAWPGIGRHPLPHENKPQHSAGDDRRCRLGRRRCHRADQLFERYADK